MGWSEHDIGDLSGRTFVITGANSGLGLRMAAVLGEHGARVLLACRSAERGRRAVRGVAGAELVLVDVADVASVRAAAAEIRERTGDRVDVLINNAGVTWPTEHRTPEGFDLTFATNHLGHAALTWLLMPALRGGTDARVVHVSSLAARGGRVHLDDPGFERRRYVGGLAYVQSKLATLLFARELDRRLRRAGEPVRSVAAHPGMAATELFPNAMRGRGRSLVAASRILNAVLTQPVERGALPLLYAATAPGADGYYGPDGPLELRGAVGRARVPRGAADQGTARRLWELTAELTGVHPEPT